MRYDAAKSATPQSPRRQLPLEQARERLRAVVDDVAQHGPVELTEGGHAVAVIVAPDEFVRLARGRPDTWAAYEKFRAEANLEENGIDDSFLEGLRDPSPGRDIEL
jgi:antitoxin (DNA-binding transcriptional repressor) of toxin-antitoxin stability system